VGDTLAQLLDHGQLAEREPAEDRAGAAAGSSSARLPVPGWPRAAGEQAAVIVDQGGRAKHRQLQEHQAEPMHLDGGQARAGHLDARAERGHGRPDHANHRSQQSGPVATEPTEAGMFQLQFWLHRLEEN
jgi:hypothetical protein